jgi:hypothetical protein
VALSDERRKQGVSDDLYGRWQAVYCSGGGPEHFVLWASVKRPAFAGVRDRFPDDKASITEERDSNGNILTVDRKERDDLGTRT